MIYYFDIMHVKFLQLCPTLCNPRGCSLPGFSVHEILQARILDWVAMPSSRGSSWLRDQTHIFCTSCIADRFFLLSHQGSPLWHCNGRHKTQLLHTWVWWKTLVFEICSVILAFSRSKCVKTHFHHFTQYVNALQLPWQVVQKINKTDTEVLLNTVHGTQSISSINFG